MQSILASLLSSGTRMAAMDVQHKLRRVAIAVAAAIVFIVAAIFALISAYQGLSTAVPPWGAALIMSGALFLVGAVLLVLKSRADRKARRRRVARASVLKSEAIAAGAVAASGTRLLTPLAALAVGYLLMRGGKSD